MNGPAARRRGGCVEGGAAAQPACPGAGSGDAARPAAGAAGVPGAGGDTTARGSHPGAPATKGTTPIRGRASQDSRGATSLALAAGARPGLEHLAQNGRPRWEGQCGCGNAVEGGLQGLPAYAHPPCCGGGAPSATGMVRPSPAAYAESDPGSGAGSGAGPGPCPPLGMLPLWLAWTLGQGLCQWYPGAGPLRRRFRRRLVPGGAQYHG